MVHSQGLKNTSWIHFGDTNLLNHAIRPRVGDPKGEA